MSPRNGRAGPGGGHPGGLPQALRGGGRDGRDAGQGCCGVWCNVGSAVLLPEVFLKAISVARNLGGEHRRTDTVNFDMLRHYRPAQNVVGPPGRPGHGHDVAGHHEILLPMLRQALIERLSSAGD